MSDLTDEELFKQLKKSHSNPAFKRIIYEIENRYIAKDEMLGSAIERESYLERRIEQLEGVVRATYMCGYNDGKKGMPPKEET